MEWPVTYPMGYHCRRSLYSNVMLWISHAILHILLYMYIWISLLFDGISVFFICMLHRIGISLFLHGTSLFISRMFWICHRISHGISLVLWVISALFGGNFPCTVLNFVVYLSKSRCYVYEQYPLIEQLCAPIHSFGISLWSQQWANIVYLEPGSQFYSVVTHVSYGIICSTSWCTTR